MLAHTLGNPFEVDAVAEIAARRGLWLIEDWAPFEFDRAADQVTRLWANAIGLRGPDAGRPA